MMENVVKNQADGECAGEALASEIIGLGYEEVCRQVERLSEKGVSGMSSHERELFGTLAEYRRECERCLPLEALGVDREVYGGAEFRDFLRRFKEDVPIEEIYGIYEKSLPREDIKNPGSMKNAHGTDELKDFYSPEEARRFTQDEINRNPELVRRIESSMKKWR